MTEAHAPPVELERLGGEAGIARWVAGFYEKVGRDPLLAPLFEDLERARDKQCDYFVELFGGPKRYSERHGKPFLRFKHRTFRIGQPERDAWMKLAMEALREVVPDEAVQAEVERVLARIADAMINYRPDRQDAYYFQR
jgi:hemoglobin